MNTSKCIKQLHQNKQITTLKHKNDEQKKFKKNKQ